MISKSFQRIEHSKRNISIVSHLADDLFTGACNIHREKFSSAYEVMGLNV